MRGAREALMNRLLSIVIAAALGLSTALAAARPAAAASDIVLGLQAARDHGATIDRKSVV